MAGCLLGSAVLAASGQTFQRIKSFEYDATSSGQVYDRVVIGSDGALYGTTYTGGHNNAGTVFKVNRDGSTDEGR